MKEGTVITCEISEERGRGKVGGRKGQGNHWKLDRELPKGKGVLVSKGDI